jgi:O-antigen/teichoic acid export membrane protein
LGLKQKTLSGLAWSGVDTVGLNLIRVAITIVLARLLQPSDFGLIALLNIFIAISDTLVQGGFSTALIRKVNVSKEEYSTVFIVNLLIGLLLYAAVYAIAPYIALYFNEPLLKPIARVLMLVVIFHSFGIVQNITLKRAINFKRLAIVNISSTILSGGAGIAMAYLGYGVWSLVAQVVFKALLTSLLLWVFGEWRLQLGFSKEAYRENLKFGYKITLANIIGIFTTNIYSVVIAKLYSASSLGFYYQGRKLSETIKMAISTVFKNVSLPVMSSVQENEERLIGVYIQFMRTVSFVTFPLMMLLIVVAQPLLLLLLTEKWAISIPYFQLFCVNGLFFPLIMISGNLPLVKGRSDIYLKFSTLFYFLMILFLLLTAKIGIGAMIIGLVVQTLIQLGVNLWFVSKIINLSFAKQIFSLADIFGVSLLVMLAVYPLKYLVESGPLLLSMQVISFSLLYLVLQHLMKSKELGEVGKIVSSKLLGRKEKKDQLDNDTTF